MTTSLLLVAALVPLLVGLLVWRPGRGRRVACALAPWGAVPALALAFVPVPADPVVIPWLLLGASVGLDVTGRVFLFFTALIWTLAGVHARTYVGVDQHRYFFFHSVALAGNLGLIVAQDLATFYLFFALMSFSAYGLVVHDGTPAAYRAGRVYIILTVAGETLLLAGFLLAAAAAPTLALPDIRAAAAVSPAGAVLVALFLGGFGIKAGAVPLHVWLPLAHPVAPTPASAVLSACMIKAGLLGWLRFLPLGEAGLPAWGQLVIVFGLVAAFYGVAAGVTQRNPKTVLAYSSVSQMGIINVAVGIALADPAAWPFVLPAIPLYALHHGLAKGALFLGVSVADHQAGRWGRWMIVAGLVLPALALVGAPFTSGAVAKLALKNAGAVAPGAWAAWLDLLLPLTAVGTTLLMARFLRVVLPGERRCRPPGLLAPWALAVAASMLAIWVMPPRVGIPVEIGAVGSGYNVWTAAWPLLAGMLAAAAAVLGMRARGGRAVREIAPGDVLILVERGWALIRRQPLDDVPIADVHGAPDPVAALAASMYELFEEGTPQDRLARWESLLVRWESAAALALLVLGALWALS